MSVIIGYCVRNRIKEDTPIIAMRKSYSMYNVYYTLVVGLNNIALIYPNRDYLV